MEDHFGLLYIPGSNVDAGCFDTGCLTQVHAKASSEEKNKHPHGCCQCHLLCLLVSDELDDIDDDDDYNDDDNDNDDNDHLC